MAIKSSYKTKKNVRTAVEVDFYILFNNSILDQFETYAPFVVMDI